MQKKKKERTKRKGRTKKLEETKKYIKIKRKLKGFKRTRIQYTVGLDNFLLAPDRDICIND